LFLVLLTGCAIGQRFDYTHATPSIALPTKGSISVGAQDRRQYVISGAKSERFVGLIRGGFGNPFDVTTASEQPFAQDVVTILSRAIEQDGARVLALSLSPSANRDEVARAIKLAKADSAIVLTINEWKTDSSFTTSVYFDLKLEEFDREGHVQRISQTSGTDQISGYQWSLNPNAVIAKMATDILKKKIEEMFSGLTKITSDTATDSKKPAD